LIFKAIFEGSCPPEIYIENQSENPVNQIGSMDNNPIPYDVGFLACAPVGISVYEKPIIRMYPNPTSGTVHFRSDEPLFVEIFNQNGRRISTETIQQQSAISIKEKGVFMAKITNQKGQTTIKKLLVY
jgi:hypothetical protein